MSLSARLSTFFLGALALVLVGFSTTLYLLGRSYLYHQVDERLQAAMDTLVAAAEMEGRGVEWEPNERHFTLGQQAGEDQVRWIVRDERGQAVDRSANLGSEDPLRLSWPALSEETAGLVVLREGQPWRVSQRRVQAEPGAVSRDPKGSEKYAFLVLTGAISQAPVAATLRRLAVTLAVLSGAVWLLAAFLGRWLCRRGLMPLTHIAATARAMSVAEWEQRLPSPQTGDELEDLSHAFNDLLARLHEAFERQRRFTGDASHQLRTPLTAMLGQIEVSLRRHRSVEEYRQVLTQVHGQGVHLRQIVEMLLFLARADAEAELPNLETVNLASWLKEYLQNWSEHPRAPDLGVELPNEDAVYVRVQPPLLGQLLDNLLDNACKYSPSGTPIMLRLEHESGVASCTVADAGCGIAAEDLPHVFEPFFRSAQARRLGYAGVGLGLTVVQRIAAGFGGTMTMQSEPGKGSRFTLRLPQALLSPAAPGAAYAEMS